MKKFDPKDDQLIRRKFEEFVRNHPGEYVAVASGKITFGKTRKEAEKKIPSDIKILPSVMQIPRKESLICAL